MDPDLYWDKIFSAVLLGMFIAWWLEGKKRHPPTNRNN